MLLPTERRGEKKTQPETKKNCLIHRTVVKRLREEEIPLITCKNI